jgi:hypothetical protein
MKSFRTYIQEGAARKDHADQPFRTLNSAGNRKLVLAGNEMVGHIDFHEGMPDIIPNSKDRYIAYINSSYRDSRLKMRRPISRTVGEFSTFDAAMKALQNAIQNLRK